MKNIQDLEKKCHDLQREYSAKVRPPSLEFILYPNPLLESDAQSRKQNLTSLLLEFYSFKLNLSVAVSDFIAQRAGDDSNISLQNFATKLLAPFGDLECNLSFETIENYVATHFDDWKHNVMQDKPIQSEMLLFQGLNKKVASYTKELQKTLKSPRSPPRKCPKCSHLPRLGCRFRGVRQRSKVSPTRADLGVHPLR